MGRPLSPSRLAAIGARVVRDAFVAYREVFGSITRRAHRHFERRDWAGLQADGTGRLDVYRSAVDDAEDALRRLLEERVHDKLVWVSMKAVFSSLIEGRQDRELAETFFNSVTRRLFATVGVDPLIEFVDTDFDGPPTLASRAVLAVHPSDGDTAALVARVLTDCGFGAGWDDLERDAALAAERLEQDLAARGLGGRVRGIEVLEPTFFRGKGAYRVGRVRVDEGAAPLVLALRNGPAGIFVDAVLTEESDVSMLFGFTRSYFHVDTPRPWEVVRFLQSLMPRKRRGELYIALGETKQGKTELYRDLLDHLHRTEERFAFAPGTPGLVMVVFALPGHSHVFKVIRDHFPAQKEVSPERVRDRYGWVYRHDRAGRIVDAQPFEHLQFPREVFEPDLLDHLLTACSKSVWLEEDEVVVDLCYVERKVRPLDLYLREQDDDAAARAAVEYGQAISDLATCGIFPGDLLTKNFGVTRHGRVAFYDYDEVCALSEVRFRVMPIARGHEDEMASEPWFSVEPGDVFPEEFPRFLGMRPAVRRALLDAHGALFTAAWWRGVQERVARGKIVEFPPYPPDRRLPEPWDR